MFYMLEVVRFLQSLEFCFCDTLHIDVFIKEYKYAQVQSRTSAHFRGK